MARLARKGKRKGSGTVVDLSDIETQVKAEEGEHKAKVVEATMEEGDAGPYVKWKFQVTKGSSKGAILYNNTSLSKASLWNLRALLEALGVEIPDSEFDVEEMLPDFTDLELMVAVEKETYQGKKVPRIVDFWSLTDKGGDEDEEEDEDEDEKPKRSAKKKAGKRARGKARDEEDEEDEEEEDEKPKRSKRKGKVVEEEDEDEEEEPKKKKKGKKGKKKELLTQAALEDMSQEELEDVIAEHEFDVELSDFKSLRKMRAAVVDAAEQAGVLEEE